MTAKVTGQFVQVGNDPYRIDASFVSPSSIRYDGERLDGFGSFTKTIEINPAPCTLLDLEDGVYLGWLVAAVWAAAFAIMVLRRAVK